MVGSSSRKAPTGLKARGRAFWRAVTSAFELDLAETELLVEVCRSIDLCEALQAVIDRDGETIEGSTGPTRLHPAITELRGTRLALSRLLAALALPGEDGSTLASPERLKARNAAGARWSAPRSGTAVSDAAREAASARWRRTGA